MGSLRLYRCRRNAYYDRRCDCIPVSCSSEDMDFSSDRDRGGNDGDRRLRGSVALTRHLTEVMRPATSQFAAVPRRTGGRFPTIQRCSCRGRVDTEAASPPDVAAQSRAGLLHFAIDSFVGGTFFTNTRYAIKKRGTRRYPVSMAVVCCSGHAARELDRR